MKDSVESALKSLITHGIYSASRRTDCMAAGNQSQTLLHSPGHVPKCQPLMDDLTYMHINDTRSTGKGPMQCDAELARTRLIGWSRCLLMSQIIMPTLMPIMNR